MDEDLFHVQVKKRKHLKFEFRLILAADDHPLILKTNTFNIVNAS